MPPKFTVGPRGGLYVMTETGKKNSDLVKQKMNMVTFLFVFLSGNTGNVSLFSASGSQEIISSLK
jgi:hypothetical protein